MERIDDSASGVKHQVASLLHASRYMRVPLIAANTLVIVMELLVG